MYIVLTVLAIILSVVLIIFVLIQNSKGGGLTSQFSGYSQNMGVRRATSFVEKATWTLMGIIIVLSIASTGFTNHKSSTSNASELSQKAQQAIETQAPANNSFDESAVMPAATPAKAEEATPAE